MAALLLQFVLAALHLTITEQVCLNETIPVTAASAGMTWCITGYPTDMNFCDAVKTCHANGQEMISKPVFDAMKRHPALFPSSPSYWWVGLTDSLSERNTSRDGWIWMLDGTVTGSAETDFDPIEPNNLNGLQDCVTTYDSISLLRDARCSSAYKTYCFISDPPVSVTQMSAAKYGKAPIVDYTQSAPGCWVLRSNTPSQLDCSVACFSFGFGDCVGFYWNAGRRECVLLPYFDASVPLGFASQLEKSQWQKFLRAA